MSLLQAFCRQIHLNTVSSLASWRILTRYMKPTFSYWWYMEVATLAQWKSLRAVQVSWIDFSVYILCSCSLPFPFLLLLSSPLSWSWGPYSVVLIKFTMVPLLLSATEASLSLRSTVRYGNRDFNCFTVFIKLAIFLFWLHSETNLFLATHLMAKLLDDGEKVSGVMIDHKKSSCEPSMVYSLPVCVVWGYLVHTITVT